MTFAAFETTNGIPVELLTFVSGTTALRYTNANIPLTVGALEYLPLEYQRNAPSISKDADDSQIRLTLPSTNPVVTAYRTILQSSITTLTIQRFHDNDPTQQVQVFWKGEISSVTVNNATAQILASPLTQGTDELPRYTYQGTCNYFLFELGTCNLARSSFKHESTIASIDSSGLQIEVTGLRVQAGVLDAAVSGSLSSDELDAYWLNGYCDVGGELRRIVRSPAGESPLVPDKIEVPYAFINAAVGQAITVYAGCAHTPDICNRKFDNLLRYGGFPTVPKNINPFETELPTGTQTSEDKPSFWTK